MRPSVTLTFTALFIGVGIFYLHYYGMPAVKREAPAADSGPAKLLDLEADAITFIQLQKPDDKETMTLERSGKEWVLKYPVTYQADKTMVDGLMTALRISQKARRLTREKGWEEYGLLQPGLKIGIEAKGLPKRKYLLLGDLSPVAAMVFARWEDEADYFLLDARFKQAFDRSVYALREKRLVRLPLNSLEKIHVQTFSNNFELSQRNSQWFWTEPIARLGKPAPREQMYEILMALRELYVKEFWDGQPVQETERGFSVSGPAIQVWDKNGKTSAVRFGNAVTEHDAYTALIDSEQVVLEVARGNIENFFKIFDTSEEKGGAVAAGTDSRTNPPA